MEGFLENCKNIINTYPCITKAEYIYTKTDGYWVLITYDDDAYDADKLMKVLAGQDTKDVENKLIILAKQYRVKLRIGRL